MNCVFYGTVEDTAFVSVLLLKSTSLSVVWERERPVEREVTPNITTLPMGSVTRIMTPDLIIFQRNGQ